MPTLSDVVATRLSERLLTLRKCKGFSQDELASKAAMPRPNLGRVENGQRANLRLSTLSRLADALDVDVLDLLVERPADEQRPAKDAAEKRLVAAVKRLRAEAGLSQEALSVRAHRFRTYVGRLENGAASPMLVDLQDLAEALGVDIPQLLQTT